MSHKLPRYMKPVDGAARFVQSEPLPLEQYQIEAAEPAIGKPKHCRNCGAVVGYVRKKWVSTPTIPRARVTYFVPDVDCMNIEIDNGGRVQCTVCHTWFRWYGPDAPRPISRK